jgi:hypothetical protein
MASSINASTSGAGGVITTADNTGILNLQTASTTAVTVDASQNVGIGTASPSTKLHVYNAGDVTSTIGSNTGASILTLTSNSNSSGAYNAIISNTASGENWYIGGLGNSNSLSFRTNGGTERMRIDSSGNVLVGGTSNIGPGAGRIAITSPDLLSTVAGLGVKNNTNNTGGSFAFWVNSSNSIIGTISQNSSTTVGYNTSSDYRLKENIAPMTGALDKVSALKPVTYTWKADGSDGQGFIAHELAEVIPDCVSGEKDAVNEDGSIKAQGVDTSFLVATLTAAIQEQQTIINDLKARVTALEAK